MTEDRKDDAAAARAAKLRGRLMDELVASGRIKSAEVEAAFRKIPGTCSLPKRVHETAQAAGKIAQRYRELRGHANLHTVRIR